ncbi:MAG: sigma-70 family RNA polymerase sigma factor [Bacteroidetes bacterium]|nr:sigma-70 family RNA polymerase sigma factor [Bacteroidota bacterium]
MISKGATKQAISLFKREMEATDLMEDLEKNQYLDQILLLEAQLSNSRRGFFGGIIHITEDNTVNVVNLALIHLVREIEEEHQEKVVPGSFASTDNEIIFSEKEPIEITLDRNFDSFSEEDKQKFLEALTSLLSMKEGDVVIKKIKPGSVKIELEMPPKKVKELILSLLQGGLPEYRVADVKPNAYTVQTKEQTNNKNNELLEYWKRFKNGDDYALGDIYEYLSPKLNLLAYKYLQDWEAAKDAVQDVFLKTLPKLEFINTNIGGYLTRALVNNCISINQRKKEQTNELDEVNVSSIKNLYEELSESEFNSIMGRMDEILTEEQREIVRLTGEGYSSKEIAKHIHKNENNVRFIRHKARGILKNDPLIKELLGNPM